MTTYAGVVRVSKLAGRKRGSDRFHADEEQLAAIRSVIPPGDQLVVLEPELDVDGGLPLLQRLSLLRAVEGVEAGDFAGIALAYQSRLFRNVEEEEAVWRRIEAAGGEILFGLEHVDNSTADGRLIRRIKASMNAAERERHAEQFDRRVAAAVAAGIWQRRQTPRGYSRAKNRKLVPNAQQDEVRWAFRAIASGTPLVDIARRLGMTPTGASQLLKNRVYLGELRVGKHRNLTAHPPLVTVEEFEAAQATLGEGVRSPRSGQPPALLAGLVRCSSCGHLMSRRSGRQYTYSCNLVNSGRCSEWASVSMHALDSYVERIALAELERLSVNVSPGKSVKRARAALDSEERELAAYLESVRALDVDKNALRAAARSRQEKVEQARDTLRAELAKRPALPFAGSGAEVWETLNGHERNTLLRGLLAAVVVKRAGGRGARVPLADRVRVLAHGFDLDVPVRRGNEPAPIVPIPLPDADADGVLRLPLGEDPP